MAKYILNMTVLDKCFEFAGVDTQGSKYRKLISDNCVTFQDGESSYIIIDENIDFIPKEKIIEFLSDSEEIQGELDSFLVNKYSLLRYNIIIKMLMGVLVWQE